MNPPQAEASLLSIDQILAMLAARRRLIAATAIGIVMLVALLLAVLPRAWTASADVYIDYRENDPISGRTLSAMLDDSYMQTQMEMIRSHAVAERVIDAMQLRNTAAHRELVERQGEARANDLLLQSLRDNIQVTATRGSRVVEVSFDGDSPESARDFVNEIVRSYIAVTQTIATNAARSRSEQYNLQLEQLRTEADTIQAKLTQYQQETGILSTDERDDLAIRGLNELVSQAALLQTRRRQAQASSDVVAAMLASGVRIEELPEVAQLPGINSMKSTLSEVDRRLSDARAKLGPQHPTVRALVEERDQLIGRIGSEARVARARAQKEVDLLAAQDAAIQADIEKRRQDILQKKIHRDRVAAYQRQLASVLQVYNTALQKYDGLLMASNITQPNLTVLRAADLPSKPSRPRVMQSLAASVIAGLFVGLSLALVLELWRRRVRCMDDMQRGMRVPLLGRIGYGEEPGGRAA